MLQKYCACHEKVEPRRTNSCNCHAKWPLQSNSSVTWKLQPFHGFSARGLKHQHHRAPATHANVFATLRNSCACRLFCNVSKSLRLPREKHFEPPKTPRDPQFLMVLTSKSLSRQSVVQIFRSSKKCSEPTVFWQFWLPNASRATPSCNFVELNFQKCSEHAAVPFVRRNRSRATAWCKFCEAQLPKAHQTCSVVPFFRRNSSRATAWRTFSRHLRRSSATPVFGSWLCEPSKPQNYGKTQHFAQFLRAKTPRVSHLCCKTSLLSNIDAARPSGNFQYSRDLDS